MPPKGSGAAKPKTAPSDHASYADMITDAIVNLKDRNGSSRIALKKYVKANNKIAAEGAMFDSLFNRALKAGVEKNIFAQPKGSSGGTKLAKKEPKAAAAKPKVEKAKAEKPKAEKKAPAEKKAKVEKKPAAKKATTTTKKAPAAKAKAAPKAKVAKKEAPAPKAKVTKAKAAPKPKKAAAAKAAPAVVEKSTVLSKTKSGRVTKTTAKTPAKKAAAPKAAPKKKATPKKAAAAA